MMPRFALCALLLASACADDQPDVATTESALAGDCSKFICGSNSPIIGGLPFFELDQTGAKPAPDSGLRIVAFKQGADTLKVRVNGSRLGGVTQGGVLLQGAALVGSKLYLENDQGTQFVVYIEGVAQNQPYWEGGDDGTKLESYKLTWTQLPEGGTPRNLCPVLANSWEFFTPPYHAMIFRGDRYDATTGQVVATGSKAGPWFNVACAGDVLSKLLVTRHAEAAQDAAHTTTKDQRTAAIRMFRADYCATGPNTELGVPLDWANIGGWNTLGQAATLANIEAIWDESGAVCLNQPRFIAPEDVPCVIPKCTAADIGGWQQLGGLITINP